MGLLNVHKKLIGKPHLAEVGNEFVSLNQERFQCFSKFAVYSQHGNYRLGLIPTSCKFLKGKVMQNV